MTYSCFWDINDTLPEQADLLMDSWHDLSDENAESGDGNETAVDTSEPCKKSMTLAFLAKSFEIVPLEDESVSKKRYEIIHQADPTLNSSFRRVRIDSQEQGKSTLRNSFIKVFMDKAKVTFDGISDELDSPASKPHRLVIE